ncbi:PREDICTED: caspase-9 [Thamnophis sirtalis]|uniref:Caspase-9 n=1 Tax=Thamnophis sirtalis TaxID=35019 RepID=A0A6I9XVC2_9SAUR|nr:PREDICTED: caspase-9 [Thamnophis sirtalis]
MEEADRRRLLRSRVQLVRKLQLEPLWAPLLRRGIFTANMIEEIQSAGPRPDQARKLVVDLATRGRRALAEFVLCLRESGQEDLAELLSDGRSPEGAPDQPPGHPRRPREQALHKLPEVLPDDRVVEEGDLPVDQAQDGRGAVRSKVLGQAPFVARMDDTDPHTWQGEDKALNREATQGPGRALGLPCSGGAEASGSGLTSDDLRRPPPNPPDQPFRMPRGSPSPKSNARPLTLSFTCCPSPPSAPRLTQRLQLLHHLLPDRLDVDAAEAPVGGDLDEVRLPEALGDDLVDVVGEVEQVLLVEGVLVALRVEGEVEEGLVKVEALVEGMCMAVRRLLLLLVREALVLAHVAVTVKIQPLLLVGQDLRGKSRSLVPSFPPDRPSRSPNPLQLSLSYRSAPTVCGLQPFPLSSLSPSLPLSGPLGPLEETPQRDSEMVYSLNSEPCGYCLIINNVHFDKRTGLKLRQGSDVDRQRLEKRFRALHFEVLAKEDLTAQGIAQELQSLAGRNHSGLDCCLVVILSHGCESYHIQIPGAIFGTDGQRIPVQKVVSYFNGSHCPSLRGKPKLFFIQACGGEEKDPGFEVETDATPGQRGGEAVESDATPTPGPGGDSDELDATASLPTDSDILVCYPTFPGHVSWRDTQSGSWFIEALDQVLAEKAHLEDLPSMLTKVGNIVADKVAGPYKQMPGYFNFLRKKFFFKA